MGDGRDHVAKAIGAGLRLNQGTHGMGAHMASPNQLYEQDEVLTLKSEGIVRVEGAKDRKWDVKLAMCERCTDKPGTSRGCQVCSVWSWEAVSVVPVDSMLTPPPYTAAL